jgi:hypothetical protein
MVCISCILLPLGLLLLSYARTILDVLRELLGFGAADATAKRDGDASELGAGKKPLTVNLAAHEWARQHVVAQGGGDAAVDPDPDAHEDGEIASNDDSGVLRNRATPAGSVAAQ